MEHITISELTSNAAPVIPYVGTKFWDGSPFLTYMEREGWSESQLTGQDDQISRSNREILSFLQTYLYFGLLAESLRIGPIGQRTYFVRTSDDGDLVISTTNLRAIWRQEKRQRSQEPVESVKDWQMHTVQCLNKAHSVLTKLAIEEVSYLSNPVILGIASLCDFVRLTVLTEESRWNCSSLSSKTTILIQNSMLVAGWCPTDVERLSQELDLASFYLVACCPRPDLQRSHAKCRQQKCEAYQTDSKAYPRKHTLECPEVGCKDIPANPVDLHDTLHTGRVALTQYLESEDGVAKINVVPATVGTRYVAISHVWSDGFGNPDANEMYTCQAQRIAKYVAAVSMSNTADVPFWLDTFSCPVKPEKDTDLAISLMRETYADAEQVLILNSHLLDRNKPNLALEMLALVVSSSWTRRLWTLQEGVLAKKVVFQFRDESIDIDSITALAQLELRQFLETDSMEYAAILNMAAMLHYLWKNPAQSNGISKDLLSLLHSELKWRSTSVPTDEPLCISALLGIPLRNIMAVDVNDRRKQFWRLIKHPPRMIAFWSGKRLGDPGYRWAPESLLDANVPYFFSARPPIIDRQVTSVPGYETGKETEVTDKGLLLRADTFKLGLWTNNVPKGFFLNPILGPLLWVTRERKARPGAPSVGSILAPKTPGNERNDRNQIKFLSLLLEHSVDYLLSPTSQGAVSAILVSHMDLVGEETGEVIHAQVEDVCSIFPVYFLTKDQQRVVDQTVEQCMQTLAEAQGEASQVTPMADIGTKVAMASEAIADFVAKSKSPHEDTSRPTNTTSAATSSSGVASTEELPQPAGEGAHLHCFVSVGADGQRRIEMDNALWWIECLQISIRQPWCLS